MSGGPSRLGETNTPSLAVSDLTQGSYVFRLTVKDNEGASASDEVEVTVQAKTNKDPVVDAGPDRTVTYPDRSTTLHGNAKDEDGEIVVYQWTKISGGSVSLDGASGTTLALSDLSEGTYVFRFGKR